MEKEIAGKILSCLRNTKNYTEEVASSHRNSSEIIKSRNNAASILFPDKNISSCTGFAFSQYIAQSVDGFKALNVEDCEEFNQKAVEFRRLHAEAR